MTTYLAIPTRYRRKEYQEKVRYGPPFRFYSFDGLEDQKIGTRKVCKRDIHGNETSESFIIDVYKKMPVNPRKVVLGDNSDVSEVALNEGRELGNLGKWLRRGILNTNSGAKVTKKDVMSMLST